MSNGRCRLCLETGSAMQPIFVKKHGVALAKLTDILQVELRAGNGLPDRICAACVSQLDAAYTFKQRCLASQKELRGQTMRAARKASAGARARRQAQKYSNSDSDSDSESDTDKDEEYRPVRKMPVVCLYTEDGSRNGADAGPRRDAAKKPKRDDARLEKRPGSRAERDPEAANKCLVCEKAFRSQSELRVHMQLHVGESPVQCSRCDKVFLNETYLGHHFESHSRPGAVDGLAGKPFKCATCDKSFLKQAHLVEHVRSHTGDRPFKCASCDKSFTTKCNLTRHARTHPVD